MTTSEIRRVLISVYDKTGLTELAAALHANGVQILSTGSTAARIADAGIPVTPVDDVTGFPECLDGRVKTLHPKIHGGLLGDRTLDSHVEQMHDLEIEPIDALVVNLYPFEATVASGASYDECIEQIDIGGPAMLRAAAKNHRNVAVITSPAGYEELIVAAKGDGFTLERRRELALNTYATTARYDLAVSTWLAQQVDSSGAPATTPPFLGLAGERADVLRYGENPHQSAALYRTGHAGLAAAKLLHGKAMSYNNYVDADAAVRAAYDHGDQPTCAVIKHANPCGIAVGSDIAQAHRKAHECDPVSAFGGIIATNKPVTKELADAVRDIFTEVVVAPSFDADALEILTEKKNLRLVELSDPGSAEVELRPIGGGFLVQERDQIDAAVDAGGDDVDRWRLVAGDAADEETLRDLEFAWRAVRSVKSNAILLAKNGASVGVGMGQVNRVDSCTLATKRAGSERARGAVAASDAFFPFPDGLQVLLDAGVSAVVAPGGSVRDEEVIEAARAAGATLYFTGVRHFAH